MLLILAALLLATPQAVTIDSPLDYQVFQRQSRDRGTILVSGHATSSVVVVKIAGTVTRVTVDQRSDTFLANIPVSAGGFYELDVDGVRVAHVGVGEVFVIAGQSNSTNYGEERTTTKSRMVTTFDGTSWRIADDPQPGVQDNSSKGSFIPAFGDAMYERYHVPIGVACVGAGSTSVRQWLPRGERVAAIPTMTKYIVTGASGELTSSGQLYEGLLKRIAQLGSHGFRALLWHQGESDANQGAGHEITGADYRRHLELIIRTSQEKSGWDFPWFVAQATYHNPNDHGSPEIRAAQRSLWEAGGAHRGPDTDALTEAYRQNEGKGVHFSAKGLEAHGKLWVEKVSAYLDETLRSTK